MNSGLFTTTRSAVIIQSCANNYCFTQEPRHFLTTPLMHFEMAGEQYEKLVRCRVLSHSGMGRTGQYELDLCLFISFISVLNWFRGEIGIANYNLYISTHFYSQLTSFIPVLSFSLPPSLCSHRLCGLVVKASASGAEDLGFESHLRRDFSGSSHTSDLKIGTPVDTLPGAWRYRVSAGTGRPCVSIL